MGEADGAQPRQVERLPTDLGAGEEEVGEAPPLPELLPKGIPSRSFSNCLEMPSSSRETAAASAER